MGTHKKTGAAGQAAALPNPWKFVPRQPVGDESAATVGAEMLHEWVLALKALPAGSGPVVRGDLVCQAFDAIRQSQQDPGRRDTPAGLFVHWLVHMSVELIQTHGDAACAARWLEQSRLRDARAAKEKAERVARLVAGRKAAAERRAVAVLSAFPRQMEMAA